jgi:hypothetical protein
MAIDIFSLQLMHKGDLKSTRGVKKPLFFRLSKDEP